MNDTRFEIRMPAERRRELVQLADQTGLTSADLGLVVDHENKQAHARPL